MELCRCSRVLRHGPKTTRSMCLQPDDTRTACQVFPWWRHRLRRAGTIGGSRSAGTLGRFGNVGTCQKPVTEFTAYMVVPFVMDKNTFIDTVRVAGNVLHRTRMTIRAAEAAHIRENRQIEGYEFMIEAGRWIARYHRDVVTMTEPVDRPGVAGDGAGRHGETGLLQQSVTGPESTLTATGPTSPLRYPGGKATMVGLPTGDN